MTVIEKPRTAERHPSTIGRTFRNPICPHGHDKRITGVYGRSCAPCHNEIAQRSRENGHKPEMRSEWCVNGHHKPTVGIGHNNYCLECKRTQTRERKRRKWAERHGVPVELFGADRDRLELRKLRESLGLTRSDLARISGIGESALRQIEQGRSKGWPTTRKKLLEALSPLIASRHQGRYTRLLMALREAERRGRPTVAEAAVITGMHSKRVAGLLGHLRRRELVERVGEGVWVLSPAGRRMVGRAG